MKLNKLQSDYDDMKEDLKRAKENESKLSTEWSNANSELGFTKGRLEALQQNLDSVTSERDKYAHSIHVLLC